MTPVRLRPLAPLAPFDRLQKTPRSTELARGQPRAAPVGVRGRRASPASAPRAALEGLPRVRDERLPNSHDEIEEIRAEIFRAALLGSNEAPDSGVKKDVAFRRGSNETVERSKIVLACFLGV